MEARRKDTGRAVIPLALLEKGDVGRPPTHRRCREGKETAEGGAKARVDVEFLPVNISEHIFFF